MEYFGMGKVLAAVPHSLGIIEIGRAGGTFEHRSHGSAQWLSLPGTSSREYRYASFADNSNYSVNAGESLWRIRSIDMASTPPSDPRTAWRAQREQQRAALHSQREAWRAQRAYWKARRQPSLVGPLILISIGVIALLLATGRIASGQFWAWYAKWWPLLLVIIGVALLVEWFVDRSSPYPARRGGGFVFLVILIIGLGWSVSAWHNWAPLREQFGDNDNDFFHFMGQEHDNDEQNSVAIPAGAHIQIQNARGDVTVAAGETDGSMHVRTHEVAYSSSDEDARRTFSRLGPKITVSGTSVLVRVDSNNSGKSDLSLEIPRDASVDVTTSHGDVTIAGCRGSVNVNSGHGDVKFDDLSANAHARMAKGDFAAHAIQGDLSLDGSMDDVTISDVRGKVLLEGNFFGDTHLEHISSPVHFHSSRTDIELARIDGDLTMDSGDLHANTVVGPTNISTRSKDIDLTQIYGDVHVQNSNGSVKLASAAPLGQVQIENHNGEVRLQVPPSASFTIDARATHGAIESDFGLPSSGDDNGRSAMTSGQVGRGGPHIVLNTTNNDIQIHKGEEYPPIPPVPPVGPAPPAPPAAPSAKGARHLTVPAGANPQPIVQQ